ncbi:MAG: nitroreductase family protein [Burkholderiales bacterium]
MHPEQLHPALALIRERTSTSRFDPSFPLSNAAIHDLIGYASEAPSSYNLQNWRFIVVKSAVNKETLQGLSYGQQQVADAAITVIVCGTLDPHRRIRAAMQPFRDDGYIDDSDLDEWVRDAETSFEDNPTKQRDEAVRSASLAAMTLMIAAQAMGLVSAPLGGFDIDAVCRQFGIRASEMPVMLVAIGRAAPGNWPRKRRRRVEEMLVVV